ncbi:MAG: DUF4476 domain-containing protein, partial [Bacteroidia bacterium]|nr:DUF4476 domain-containing protein [Bacteroidia bacterium]
TPNPPPPAGSQNQSTTIVFNPTIQVQTGSGTQINTQPPPTGNVPNTPQLPSSGTGYAGPCNCHIPISRENLSQALLRLQKEPFEDTRLHLAMQLAQKNCLLAQDVREIMQSFTFDENRLNFAKYAYDYVHDIGNYIIVTDALNFSSSKEALMQYIEGRPARHYCQGGSTSSPSHISSGPRPCRPCMEPAAFSQALHTLRSTSSEPARLEVARQIATTNCLSSTQVREICRTLMAEPNRLEFAKFAYTRCCDPQNYFTVGEAFAAVTSREELARYIQSLSGR